MMRTSTPRCAASSSAFSSVSSGTKYAMVMSMLFCAYVITESSVA